jgi:hypothetical protein
MKRIRKMGDIMFDLEKEILKMCYKKAYSWDRVLKLTYYILEKNHKQQQEEYIKGGNPIVKMAFIDVSRLVNKPTKYRKIIAEMSKSHDMQWNEVLALVKGYLEVHCPDKKGKLKFYYGA